MVKNEADIIEASVRHNLFFADLYVAVDNGSSDGTREILWALQAEGLPVLVFEDDSAGHHQAQAMTKAFRQVAPIYEPDVVFLLDADEFITAPSRSTLEQHLSKLPRGTQALIPWKTFLPDPAASFERRIADPLGSFPWRRQIETPCYHKSIIVRDADMDAVLEVEPGNHGVRTRDSSPLPSSQITHEGVFLAHLPVRSAQQVTAKAVNGWHACLIKTLKKSMARGEAYQWKLLYDRITGHGDPVADDDVSQIALNYAQQPRSGKWQHHVERKPVDARYGELQYMALGRHDPMAKVALSTAAFIESLRVHHAEDPRAGSDSSETAALIEALMKSMRLETHQLRGTPSDGADLLVAPNLDVDQIERILTSSDSAFENSRSRWLMIWPSVPISGKDAAGLAQLLSFKGWQMNLKRTAEVRSRSERVAVRTGALVLERREARQMLPELGALSSMTDSAARMAGESEHAPNDPDPAPLLKAPNPPSVTEPPPIGLIAPRVAVVTPYFKEPREWLERCIDSVRRQTHACTHIVVSDGHPQEWLDNSGVRHIRLDRSHGDFGNTPRAIGAQLAIAGDYDAITFLDADNWYALDHIEGCLQAASRFPCDYVVTKRQFARVDGSVLPYRLREDENFNHIDTSCFFLLKGAFHTVPRWLLMPQEVAALGDRVYARSLRAEGLIERQNDRASVFYLCTWRDVYEAVGEPPPNFAKPPIDVRGVGAWIKKLQHQEKRRVNKLLGFPIEWIEAEISR
jgi:glycosyltransferase involved in cell wall biosynthesis